MPTRPLTAAPTPGSRGMSQIYRICVRVALRDPPDLRDLPDLADLSSSPSHQIHFVDVDRLFVAIEGQDDANPHRRFGRPNRDDEDREDLANRLFQLRRDLHKVEFH